MATIRIMGVGEASSVNRSPASADAPEPATIDMAPAIPEAVPARCGRTDKAPAVALGKMIPLLIPIKTKNPKKPIG